MFPKSVSKALLLFCLTIAIQFTSQQRTILREEVHSEASLTCTGPVGTTRWYYRKTDNSLLLPITADNGSHYQIQPNFAGLRIPNCLETDAGIYIVQGDGGVECEFQLNIFGIFSFNSGTKDSMTGVYGETIEATNGYGLTVSCSYDITEISNAQNNFVVQGIIDQVNLLECTSEAFPYCQGCEACYPIRNNSFRKNIVYPAVAPSSTTLTCRVYLGLLYNGKTVDKIVTLKKGVLTQVTYVLPYKSTHQLCSNNISVATRSVLVSKDVTQEGIPLNRALYTLEDLPSMELLSEQTISCQNLDDRGFPIVAEIYQYSIQLSAIPAFLNTQQQQEVGFYLSYCDSDPVISMTHTFNCSYQLTGASAGQPLDKNEVVTWTLDGVPCTFVCERSGTFREENSLNIRELGNDRITQTHTVQCSVSVNGVSVSREWNIGLSFKVCETTTTTTTTTMSTTSTTATTTTTPMMTDRISPSTTTALVVETRETTSTPSTPSTQTATTPQTNEIVSTPSTAILIAIIIPAIIFVFIVLATMIVIAVMCIRKGDKRRYEDINKPPKVKPQKDNPQEDKTTEPEDNNSST